MLTSSSIKRQPPTFCRKSPINPTPWLSVCVTPSWAPFLLYHKYLCDYTIYLLLLLTVEYQTNPFSRTRHCQLHCQASSHTVPPWLSATVSGGAYIMTRERCNDKAWSGRRNTGYELEKIRNEWRILWILRLSWVFVNQSNVTTNGFLEKLAWPEVIDPVGNTPKARWTCREKSRFWAL